MAEPAGSGILWRISNAEKRLDDIEKYSREFPVIRRDLEELKVDMVELKEEVKNSKRATWAVFIAIFGVGISLTANVIAGSIG